jgi:hypothetical protein
VEAVLLATRTTLPPGQIAPLLFFAAVNIAAAFMLFFGYRFRWISLALVVFTMLLVLVSAAAGAFWGLQHPDSFFDFVPYLTLVAGPLTALVALIIARRRRRRGTNVPGGRDEHITVTALLAVSFLVASMSGVRTLAARRNLHIPPGAVVVYAEHNRFRPSTLRAKAGRILTIAVVNRDAYAHRLSPEHSELLTSDYIGPNGMKLIRMRVMRPSQKREATEMFRCDVTGHDGMNGKILVTAK